MWRCEIKQLSLCILMGLIPLNLAFAYCWEEASTRYNVPVPLLKAITEVESNFNPKAREILKDSESIGLMQINSFWYDKLHAYDINRNDLFNPCVNVNIGAWIISQEIKRYGLTWQAIGAYNAGAYTDKNREKKLKLYLKYSKKVISKINKYIN